MKILFFDVENLPNIVNTFTLYKTSIPHTNIIENQSIISIAWKWGGQKKIYCSSIIDDMNRFKKNVYDDFIPVKRFHEILNTADSYVLCGHNSRNFDLKKLNTAFIKHGLEPTQERQMIDTLTSAWRYFRFDSNRLDYLARFLKVGEKLETGGYQLWLNILQSKYPEIGHKKDLQLSIDSVKAMCRYNKVDVAITEKCYEKLKPFINNHPNYALYIKEQLVCIKCGSTDIVKAGWRYMKSHRYQRYACKDCKSKFDPPNKLREAYSGSFDDES